MNDRERGALAISLSAAEGRGALTLVPFLAIATTFEMSFFIHMGIERVGRYLQVLYEAEGHGWESTIMASRARPGPIQRVEERRRPIPSHIQLIG